MHTKIINQLSRYVKCKIDTMLSPTHGFKWLQFFTITIRGFVQHRCGLHAAGLTYIASLSLVPILLLMLFLTKPCGLYEWARSQIITQTDIAIETFFEKPPSTFGVNTFPTSSERQKTARAYGAQARVLRDQVVKQVDAKIAAFNFGMMAWIGLGVLIWTVVKTFGAVEASFNEIWNVSRNRPLWRKLCLYLSTLAVLPILVALAMSLPLLRLVKTCLDATLGATVYTKWVGDVVMAFLTSTLFSYALTWIFAACALAFLFKMMPNRYVSLRSAFEGGFITAFLLGAWMRFCAMAQFGIASASAAYGSFALFPILIVWMNMSWVLLLLGSNMTYAFQCIHSRVCSLVRV